MKIKKKKRKKRKDNYHEKRVGRLHKTLELVLPLLKLSRRVEQIDVVLKNLTKPKLQGKETVKTLKTPKRVRSENRY